MNKKNLLLIAVFCIIAISQVHALGLGVQGNWYLSFEEEDKVDMGMDSFGFSVLVSPSRDLNFAGNYYFSRTSDVFGLTADFCPQFLNFRLLGSGPTLLSNPSAWSFNFAIGLGGYVNVWVLYKDIDTKVDVGSIDVSGGFRFPIGFNLNLGGGLIEIFTHVAPSIGLYFAEGEEPFGNWFFPVALGVRIWL